MSQQRLNSAQVNDVRFAFRFRHASLRVRLSGSGQDLPWLLCADFAPVVVAMVQSLLALQLRMPHGQPQHRLVRTSVRRHLPF